MDYQRLITIILEIVIIPLLGVLTTYLVKYLQKKSNELIAKTDNETAQKYINMLNETISSCVMATTQTYVEALKKQDAFTKEAQKEAFAQTYNNIVSILSEDCLKYLTTAYEDLEHYIINRIEAEVSFQKK